MQCRRARGEAGASLILALGALTLFGLLIPVILNLGTTNGLATSRLHDQRDVVYSADAAVDGTIQYLVKNPQCGRYVPCAGSTFSLTLNGIPVAVAITSTAESPIELDRTVELVASSGGKDRIEARIVIEDSNPDYVDPPVEVTYWRYLR